MRIRKKLKIHFDAMANGLNREEMLAFYRPHAVQPQGRVARRRRFLPVAAVCVCAAVGGAVCLFGILFRPTEVVSDASVEPSAAISAVSEVVPSGEETPRTVTLYGGNDGGELFAPDLFRPEGYDENIGSALALMMENSPAGTAFDVLLTCPGGADWETLLRDVNERLAEPIDPADLQIAEITDAPGESSFWETPREEGRYSWYCLRLDAEQIRALAKAAWGEGGVRLSYIGNGSETPAITDMGWGSPEWLRDYCERLGDRVAFRGQGTAAADGSAENS